MPDATVSQFVVEHVVIDRLETTRFGDTNRSWSGPIGLRVELNMLGTDETPDEQVNRAYRELEALMHRRVRLVAVEEARRG